MAQRISSKPKDLSKLASRVSSKLKLASELEQHFRGCVYGRSGMGKTRLVSTLPNVLVIDVNDKGTDSVRRDYNPTVYPVEYWGDLNEIFWFLEGGEHKFESVAIDGVTSMQTLCMKFVLGDEAARDASRDPDMPSRQIYGKVNELMKTQILNFRNLPMNVMFTALERKKATGEDDEEVDVEIYSSPECSPGVAKTLEAAVGLIGYIDKKQVMRPKKEGEKKSRRVTRTRMLIGPSERYLTKDRYGLMVPYLDAPNMNRILKTIYAKEA